MLKGTLGFMVLLVAGFLLLLVTIPARVLVDLMNGLFLGVVGAVMIVYSPLLYRMFDSRRFDRISQMVLGIVILWLAAIIGRTLSVIVNALGPQVRDQLMPCIAGVAFLGILAGVLQLSATGTVDKQLTDGTVERWRYNRGLLLAAGAVGVVIFLATVWVQRNGLTWPAV